MKRIWISVTLVAIVTGATSLTYWRVLRGSVDTPNIIRVNGGADAPAPPPRIAVTLEEFNKVEVDMTYEQVRDIIGEDGMIIGADGVRGAAGKKVFTTLIEWPNGDGSAMSGQFRNGRLISKNQHDLH